MRQWIDLIEQIIQFPKEKTFRIFHIEDEEGTVMTFRTTSALAAVNIFVNNAHPDYDGNVIVSNVETQNWIMFNISESGEIAEIEQGTGFKNFYDDNDLGK